MPYTQADLDAVQAAIASGEMTVRSNGREVTYRSITELQKAEAAIRTDLAGQAAPGQRTGGPWRVQFQTLRGED